MSGRIQLPNPSLAALRALFAGKSSVAAIIIADDGTGTHSTLEDGFAAVTTGARVFIKPKSSGSDWLATGPITLPNVDGVSVESTSRTVVARVRFPAGDGFKWSNTARNSGWTFRNVWITGTGVDGSSRGVNGIGLNLAGCDRTRLSNFRVTQFLTGIYADGALGGCHMCHLDNIYVTACTTGIRAAQGSGLANGANQWTIVGGEITGNTTGIKTDDGHIDGWTLVGTDLESNTTAVDWGGVRSAFYGVRMESNTTDFTFGTTSAYNFAQYMFGDITKVTDNSTTKSNTIDMRGFSTTSTEYPEPLFTLHPREAVDNVTAVAGTAYFAHIRSRTYRKITTATYVPTTVAGNVEVAIVKGGAAVVSTVVAVAQDAANGNRQVVTLGAPVYLEPNRDYWVMLAFDGAAAFAGRTAATTGYTRALGITNTTATDGFARQKASFTPTSGKTVSGLSSTANVPCVVLS